MWAGYQMMGRVRLVRVHNNYLESLKGLITYSKIAGIAQGHSTLCKAALFPDRTLNKTTLKNLATASA